MSLNASLPPGFVALSNPGTPVGETSSFDLPSLPSESRIAKLSRTLSTMSNALSGEPEEIKDTISTSPIDPITRLPRMSDIPALGTDEVLCPFCSKPLPPTLLAAQTGHNHVKEPSTEDITIATAESLLGDVQSGDKANISAASNLITPEDLKRWSELAGVPPPKSEEPVAGPSKSPPPTKVIPLLPPPPGSNKLTKPPPDGKFSFGFRRASQQRNDDDSESEDDMGVPSGYAKLSAPGSPGDESDDEGEGYGGVSMKKGKMTVTKAEPEVSKSSETKLEEAPETKSPAAETKSEAPDGDVREILKEVVNRVNLLSTSHANLLDSHSTLLTSLKIARSNLAMAEANAEMLEDELRRSKATSRVVSGQARTPVTPAPGLQRAVSSAGTRPSSDQPRAVSAAAPRTSMGDKPRPGTISIPASNLFPTPGPSSAAPSSASVEQSKSVFGFWKGGKQKLPGGLGTVTIPSPAQVMAAIPSRPGTPTGESRFDISAWAPPDPSTIGSGVKPSPHRNIEAPGLMRSASYSTISSPPSNVPGAGGVARQSSLLRDDGSGTITAKSPPTTSSELFKLRQAYSSAVQKMSTMSTELDNLKKGKIEMEAELEGLSQALFEEANKMVADERKKRLEVEEGLKDVIQEREALKKVVEVLGGKTEDIPEVAAEKVKDVEKITEKEEFQPRDLDKHYQALRETIHHVGDGSPTKRILSANNSVPTSPTPLRNDTTSKATIPSNPMSSEISPPTEPNPWASIGTPSESTLLPPLNIPKAESPLLPPVDLRPPSSNDISGEGELPIPESSPREGFTSPAVQNLDRLMEDLKADMRDES